MSEVTNILEQIEGGKTEVAEKLLPLVYQELRKLAAAKLRRESPVQTLAPTGLVHEAYLRLVDGETVRSWNGRGHFFAAAAESMRRILIERARRNKSLKRGGEFQRISFVDNAFAEISRWEELLAIDEALDLLEESDPRAAEVVKLRFFGGLTISETAQALGISRATADNDWAYARSWLRVRLDE